MSSKKEINFQDSLYEAFGNTQASPVMTFHPRLDIPNGTLGEIHATNKIARAFGKQPLWAPFTYDIGFTKGNDWDKSAVAGYYEGETMNIVSAIHAGSKPVCMIDGFNQKHIEQLIPNMKKTFQTSLKSLIQQIDEIKFGHPLFHLKNRKEVEKIEAKFMQSLSMMQSGLEQSINQGNLSSQLTYFNCQLARLLLNAEVEATPMDQTLAENDELRDVILDNYEETQEISGPMMKTWIEGDRISLVAKNDTFTAGSKTFSKEEVAQLIKQRRTTITAELFLSALNFLGHPVTIGGVKTDAYYQHMFPTAAKISDVWGKPFGMKYIVYDHLGINSQALSLQHTAATLKVIDGVVTRKMAVGGKFKPAADVSEHLAYIMGDGAIPAEFSGCVAPESRQSAQEKKQQQLDKIKAQKCGLNAAETGTLKALAQKFKCKPEDREYMARCLEAEEEKIHQTPYEKKQSQLRLIDGQLGTLGDLTDDSVDLKLLAQTYNCSPQDKGYIRKSLEIERDKLHGQGRELQHDADTDRTFLGGTIDGYVQNGVLHRSQRFPSGLQLMLSNMDVQQPDIMITTNRSSNYCLGTIVSDNQTGFAEEYASPEQVFDDFLNPRNLPFGGFKKLGPEQL